MTDSNAPQWLIDSGDDPALQPAMDAMFEALASVDLHAGGLPSHTVRGLLGLVT